MERVGVCGPGVAWSPAADLSSTGTTPALCMCMCLPGSVDEASTNAGCGWNNVHPQAREVAECCLGLGLGLRNRPTGRGLVASR